MLHHFQVVHGWINSANTHQHTMRFRKCFQWLNKYYLASEIDKLHFSHFSTHKKDLRHALNFSLSVR